MSDVLDYLKEQFNTEWLGQIGTSDARPTWTESFTAP